MTFHTPNHWESSMNRNTSIRTVVLCSIVIFVSLGALFFNKTNPENKEISFAEEVDFKVPETPQEQLSIIEIISSYEDFSTFAKALQAADLVNALKGNGTFTVFAPSNEAFDLMRPGTLQNLLKPENKTKLSSILTYHIVPGRHPVAGLKSGKLRTLNGKELTVVSDGKNITVNKVKVVQSNVIGANGIIYVVDGVIPPQ